MYWIKTYGARLSDLRFHRYPSAIEKAREAIADPDVVGYLVCHWWYENGAVPLVNMIH